MARDAGPLINPVNGHSVQTHEGYSWGALVFGVFWFLHKGMEGWFLKTLLLVLVTGGLAWLYIPFVSNRWHREYYLTKGYVAGEQQTLPVAKGQADDAIKNILVRYANETPIHFAEAMSDKRKQQARRALGLSPRDSLLAHISTENPQSVSDDIGIWFSSRGITIISDDTMTKRLFTTSEFAASDAISLVPGLARSKLVVGGKKFALFMTDQGGGTELASYANLIVQCLEEVRRELASSR